MSAHATDSSNIIGTAEEHAALDALSVPEYLEFFKVLGQAAGLDKVGYQGRKPLPALQSNVAGLEVLLECRNCRNWSEESEVVAAVEAETHPAEMNLDTALLGQVSDDAAASAEDASNLLARKYDCVLKIQHLQEVVRRYTQRTQLLRYELVRMEAEADAGERERQTCKQELRALDAMGVDQMELEQLESLGARLGQLSEAQKALTGTIVEIREALKSAQETLQDAMKERAALTEEVTGINARLKG